MPSSCVLDAVIVCVRCRLLRVLDADPRVIHTRYCVFVSVITAFPALIVAVGHVLDADPRVIHTRFCVFVSVILSFPASLLQ